MASLVIIAHDVLIVVDIDTKLTLYTGIEWSFVQKKDNQYPFCDGNGNNVNNKTNKRIHKKNSSFLISICLLNREKYPEPLDDI